jgi:hypothetical protein
MSTACERGHNLVTLSDRVAATSQEEHDNLDPWPSRSVSTPAEASLEGERF